MPPDDATNTREQAASRAVHAFGVIVLLVLIWVVISQPPDTTAPAASKPEIIVALPMDPDQLPRAVDQFDAVCQAVKQADLDRFVTIRTLDQKELPARIREDPGTADWLLVVGPATSGAALDLLCGSIPSSLPFLLVSPTSREVIRVAKEHPNVTLATAGNQEEAQRIAEKLIQLLGSSEFGGSARLIIACESEPGPPPPPAPHTPAQHSRKPPLAYCQKIVKSYSHDLTEALLLSLEGDCRLSLDPEQLERAKRTLYPPGPSKVSDLDPQIRSAELNLRLESSPSLPNTASHPAAIRVLIGSHSWFPQAWLADLAPVILSDGLTSTDAIQRLAPSASRRIYCPIPQFPIIDQRAETRDLLANWYWGRAAYQLLTGPFQRGGRLSDALRANDTTPRRVERGRHLLLEALANQPPVEFVIEEVEDASSQP